MVSSNAVTPESVTMQSVTVINYDVLCERAETINNTLNMLLGVLLFIWLERKIASICEKFILQKGGRR